MSDYLLTYSTREDWAQRATVARVSNGAPARHRLISASTKGEAIGAAQRLCKSNDWTMHSLNTRRSCEGIAQIIDRLKLAPTPATARKGPAMSLSIGQEWRCRGGGEWRIISKNADGAFVGQSLRAPAVLWQFQADGRTCLSLSERERSTMDLVELLAPKAPQ